MTETLTPAQKGARTRAANKAKLAALEAAASKPTTDAENNVTVQTGEIDVQGSAKAAAAVEVQLPEVVETVVDTIDTIGNNKDFQVTASRVTSKFSAKTRNIIYTVGIVLGVVATVGAPVVAGLTGTPQIVAASVVGLGYSLSNLLAKLNLSKTATDLAKEKAAA